MQEARTDITDNLLCVQVGGSVAEKNLKHTLGVSRHCCMEWRPASQVTDVGVRASVQQTSGGVCACKSCGQM